MVQQMHCIRKTHNLVPHLNPDRNSHQTYNPRNGCQIVRSNSFFTIIIIIIVIIIYLFI